MRKLTFLRSLAIVVLLFFLSYAASSGQVTVFSPHVIGDTDQTVKVEVKVMNFASMLNTQFTLQFDSLILEFLGVGDYGIFNINPQSFGIPQGAFPTPNGIVTFAWIADNVITGQTLADSSVLFTVEFKIIGSNGEVSPIHFSDDPTYLEFGDTSGMAISYVAYDGSVTVSGTSDVEEIITEDFIFYPIFPNPARADAQLRFRLERASQTSIRIFDMAGSEIYQRSDSWGRGIQSLVLPKELFPAAGTYFAHLTTEHAQAVQKLIVLR